jgi:hypothetical protein
LKNWLIHPIKRTGVLDILQIKTPKSLDQAALSNGTAGPLDR